MSVNVASGEDIEIPPHRKVVFNPSKELATLVNSPFEMFEAVEVSEEAADELETIDEAPVAPGSEHAEDLENSENTVVTENLAESESLNNSDRTEDIGDTKSSDNSEDTDDSEDSVDSVNIKESEEQDSEIDETPDNSDEDKGVDIAKDNNEYVATDDTEKTHRKHERGYRFMWGFFAGFISALIAVGVGIGVIYVLGFTDTISRNIDVAVANEVMSKRETTAAKSTDATSKKDVPDANVATENPQMQDAEENKVEKNDAEREKAKAQVATAPSDEKVYDTITKTRYLTTMAKDHYGNYNLWPYIYEENKNILGHPDRIRPGTQVVIPKLSKYGVNPNSEEDIRTAKRKGVEIYSRYK